MNTDVLVIGGGIAGSVAALSASRFTDSVILASDKPGASRLHSGIFDTDADPGRVRDISVPDNNLPEKNLDLTALTSAFHPFSILGGGKVERLFQESLYYFLDALTTGGLPVYGFINQKMLLMTSLGAMKRARYALSSIAAGNVTNPSEMKILFLGIDGLSDFDPQFIAKSCDAAAAKIFGSGFAAADFASVSLDRFNNFSNLTSTQVAGLLEKDSEVKVLATSMQKLIGEKEYTHIAMPAVLGYSNNSEIIAILKEGTGAQVFEITGCNPSVPGERIMAALGRALDSAGVKRIRAKVSAVPDSGDVIIVTPHGDSDICDAGSIVLATGKYIGGGIVHDEFVRETVFNLPVFAGSQQLMPDSVVMELTTPRISERQPLFSCGLAADSSLRPLGAEPGGRNIFCAGSVIGGYDPYRENCGTGVAVLTGYLAGALAGKESADE